MDIRGAAQLHTIKKNGGWNEHNRKVVQIAAEYAVEKINDEAKKIVLKVVK